MNITPSYGKITVRASDYLKQDSSLQGGGTDETEILQAILDKAPEWGGLTLEVDGVILTRGFKLHSNTTIHCANQNCGFYLADESNVPLVQNAHLDFDEIREENIALLGGTYHLNCEHQQRTDGSGVAGTEGFAFHTTHGMLFYGVRGLTMRDVRTIDQRIFTALFANWEDVVIENMDIELPHNYYAQNQDGLHFWGPGKGLYIRNIRGCSGDDFIALAPDEHDFKSDITDVLIDGVYLKNADQGIRMLSRGPGKLDRVTVRNVYGTYKSCGFFINPAFGVDLGDCEGNYGCITVENVDLQTTYHKYKDCATPFLFRIGGRMQSLTLKNIRALEPNDARPLVEVTHIYGHWCRQGSCVDVANLIVDGVEVLNRQGTTDPAEYITVDGKVDHMVVRNVLVNRDGHPAADRIVAVKEKAQIGTLAVSQVQAFGIEKAVDLQGGTVQRLTMKEIFVDNQEETL